MNPCAPNWARTSSIARNKHPTEPSSRCQRRQPLQHCDQTKLKNSVKLHCNCASDYALADTLRHSIINFSVLAYNLIHRDLTKQTTKKNENSRSKTRENRSLSDCVQPYLNFISVSRILFSISQCKNEFTDYVCLVAMEREYSYLNLLFEFVELDLVVLVEWTASKALKMVPQPLPVAYLL